MQRGSIQFVMKPATDTLTTGRLIEQQNDGPTTGCQSLHGALSQGNVTSR